MYKKYTVKYNGNLVNMYVKPELQDSFEKISDKFPFAKFSLAEIVVDSTSKAVLKGNFEAYGDYKN